MKKERQYEFVDGRIVPKEDNSSLKESPLANFFEEDDATDNTEAFENAKANFEQKKSKERITSIIVAVCAVMLFTVGVLAFAFPLKTVSVQGQTQYDTQQIIEYAQQFAGGNVILANKSSIESGLLNRFTRLKSVEIIKDYPNGITVELTEDTAKYYVSIDEEYYLLADDLRIMQRTQDENDTKDLLFLETDGISAALTGSELEFYASYQKEYVKDVLSEISDHAMYDGVVSVDMTDKFNIKLDYDGRFTVILGIGESIGTKMSLAMAYIQSIPENERGIIDSSSTEKGSYISLMK